MCFSGSDFDGSLLDVLSLKYFVDKDLVKLVLKQIKAAGILVTREKTLQELSYVRFHNNNNNKI